MYQKIKDQTKVLVGKLIANEMLEKIWTYLTVDFIIYHEVAVSSRQEYKLSSVWHVVQDSLFYNNNRRNISRRINEVI